MDIPDLDKITEPKDINCVDCKKDFIFGVGEQKYFVSKGLYEPKRCPQCRALRKATLGKDRGQS